MTVHKVHHIIQPLIAPLEAHAKHLLSSLVQSIEDNQKYVYLYKGELLNKSDNLPKKIQLLPKEHHRDADEYLAYVKKVQYYQLLLHNYLNKSLNSLPQTTPNAVFMFLPSSCHFLYDIDRPTVDNFPTWLTDLVNESLMMRALYELP